MSIYISVYHHTDHTLHIVFKMFLIHFPIICFLDVFEPGVWPWPGAIVISAPSSQYQVAGTFIEKSWEKIIDTEVLSFSYLLIVISSSDCYFSRIHISNWLICTRFVVMKCDFFALFFFVDFQGSQTSCPWRAAKTWRPVQTDASDKGLKPKSMLPIFSLNHRSLNQRRIMEAKDTSQIDCWRLRLVGLGRLS